MCVSLHAAGCQASSFIQCKRHTHSCFCAHTCSQAASQEAHDSAKALKVLLSVEDLIEGRDEIALRSGSRLASRASPALRALLNLPT